MEKITKPDIKLLRVTQMNAIFLDKEIYRTFTQIIQDLSKHFPPGLTAPYEPEINLMIKIALLKCSVLRNGRTFGQQLLTIQYKEMSVLKRYLYLLLCCSDYIKQRFELSSPSHSFNNTIYKLELIIVILNFINISRFLRSGSKPLLVERLLGLQQVYETASKPRYFQSKYLARELLWNGFIEILVNIVPLINYHKLKRIIRNYNWFQPKEHYVVMGKRELTLSTKCAHCGENPILPHHMGCSHIFCYVCLRGNQKADSKYECPICKHKNVNILCDKVIVI